MNPIEGVRPPRCLEARDKQTPLTTTQAAHVSEFSSGHAPALFAASEFFFANLSNPSKMPATAANNWHNETGATRNREHAELSVPVPMLSSQGVVR